MQRITVMFVGALFPLGFAPIDYWPLTLLSLMLVVNELLSRLDRIGNTQIGAKSKTVGQFQKAFSKQKKSDGKGENLRNKKSIWSRIKPSQSLSIFWIGFYWSLGAFGIGVSWVYVSIHEFGHVPVIGAMFISLLFVLLLSLIKACGFKLMEVIGRSIGRTMFVLIIPFCWVVFDLVQSHIFSGFPWLFAGYSQIDGPLSSLSTWVGVYGVTWFMMIIITLVVEMLRRYRLNDVTASAVGLKLRTSVGVLVVLVTFPILVALNNASIGKEKAAEQVKNIKVALVQPNVSQTIKWDRLYFSQIMDILYLQTNAHWEADLIVWPEGAIPAYKHQVQDIIFDLERKTKKGQSNLLLGLPVYDREESLSFSAMFAVGHESQTYHKQVLVPFGEYVPLGQLIRGLMDFLDMPMSDFSPAISTQNSIDLGDYSVIPAICYEIAYPGIIHDLVKQADRASSNPKLLVTISNDAWFGDSLGPYQHMQMARMRALELGLPLVRSTNDGITAVVDAHGTVLKQLNRFTQDSLIYDLSLQSYPTVYRNYGLSAIYTILLVSFLFFLVLHLGRKR
jgi:apolipoprotein N-acyltransferase